MVLNLGTIDCSIFIILSSSTRLDHRNEFELASIFSDDGSLLLLVHRSLGHIYSPVLSVPVFGWGIQKFLSSPVGFGFSLKAAVLSFLPKRYVP